MILLDTHIWIWWVHGDTQLSPSLAKVIQKHEDSGLGVSLFSCWEVAKLVENQRLMLPKGIDAWLKQALAYPGIRLFDLTLPIIIESTRLPGEFHRDPADQMIVATARIHQLPIVTVDRKIRAYPHVQTISE